MEQSQIPPPPSTAELLKKGDEPVLAPPPMELVKEGWQPPAPPLSPRPTPWWRELRTHLRLSPLQAIEATVAVSMLGCTILNSVVMYHLQEVAIKQQTIIAKAALDGGEIVNLRDLFSSNLPQINLRTTEGKAAYATCLQAAIKLDRQPHGISYVSMLPRYDEENLALSLARDPELLSMALKHGPKPAPPVHAETLFYVSVAFVGLEARSQLETLKTNLRGELNRNSSTSQYPLRIMRLRHPDGLVLTVGGLQSHATAGEIRGELKSLASPIAATIVRSDRVVRQAERAVDTDVKRGSK